LNLTSKYFYPQKEEHPTDVSRQPDGPKCCSGMPNLYARVYGFDDTIKMKWLSVLFLK
jgi:hypothetical protein